MKAPGPKKRLGLGLQDLDSDELRVPLEYLEYFIDPVFAGLDVDVSVSRGHLLDQGQ